MTTLAAAAAPELITLTDLSSRLATKAREDNPNCNLFDLGCGKTPATGYTGVDLYSESADVRHDLENGDWSFCDDNSVGVFFSSHYVEHVNDIQRFFAKAWEKLVNGGYFLATTPFGNSPRAWLDPDHKRPIYVELYWRFNKQWRETNDVDHYYPYPDTNFDIVEFYPVWNKDFAHLNEDAKQYHFRHTFGAVDDITVLLRAVK